MESPPSPEGFMARALEVALRPEAWNDLDHMEGEFVCCKRWLPGSNSKQAAPGQIERFIQEFHDPAALPPWVYRDSADFGAVNVAKGRRQLLPPPEAQAARSQQRRYREPRPPRIQAVLKDAIDFKARLAAIPGLTRDALAKEVGINPVQMTRLLRLADLAPEIKEYIQGLSPIHGMGLLTERRLRAVARLLEKADQLREFRRLLAQPLRVKMREAGSCAALSVR
jgi:hypothetical protein